MNETELGYDYDISYEPKLQTDVVFVDCGDDGVYLTQSDLLSMLALLS